MRVRPNTNVDVLPHVALLLDTVIRGLTLSRALHKRLGDYRIGRRCPSYPKLGELMELLAAAQASTAYSRLQELLGRRLFWAEIVDIEAGQAHVFDLTVPGSHSFCANGFVNHNTYLAVASAVQALEQDRVRRIVLTRPAVEAGEKLGFLPGDMAQKVDPYLRPLYDALYEMIGFERVARLVERAVIEVAPLAFMRGRTLSESFLILDEAQNTTTEQMKMFLTRIGFGSVAVVTGDVTQIDLPRHQTSGLKHTMQVLQGVSGVRFCQFEKKDVVRHPLVQSIVHAYEIHEAKDPEPRA